VTSGASTGGGSAGIAAGLGPVALGTDGGGSIRRPSSYNNLVGLKPSRPIRRRLQSFILVAIEDLVASLARNAERTAHIAHAVAFQQAGDKSKTLIHDRSLSTRHRHLPIKSKSVTHVFGTICHLSLRSGKPGNLLNRTPYISLAHVAGKGSSAPSSQRISNVRVISSRIQGIDSFMNDWHVYTPIGWTRAGLILGGQPQSLTTAFWLAGLSANVARMPAET